MAVGLWIDAARHRAHLTRVTFVAITGSCGKSTAAHLAAGILEESFRGRISPIAANCGDRMARSLLRVSASDDFYVQELGAWGPTTLDPGIRLIRPSIGVMLNIRRDHYGAFHGLANTQAEKAKLIASLPRSGVAILNNDDARVRQMGALTDASKLWFGRSSSADLQAVNVSSRWPGHLSFDLLYRSTRYPVQTRLLGEQCLGSALAALGVAVAFGMPIETALQRLSRIEPLTRRMSSITLHDGVTFIRDDFKSPSDSMSEALRFMATATAAHKVAVVGRISDHPGRSRPIYTEFATAAADVLDELVFVGERAWSLWSLGDAPWRNGDYSARARVRVFRTVESASCMLNPELRTGALVLLKGSGRADHLERILHDRTVAVSCWLTDCGRVEACEECELMRTGTTGA